MAQRKGDARLELFYGVFLDQFGQYPDAVTHLQKALVDSPKKQQVLFELGSTYLAAGDAVDALPPFKQAYDETPKYDEALLYYAAGLYYNKQNAAADALLTQRYGTVLVDQQQILQAYFANKLYDRLAGIYQARLATNPADLQSAVGHAVLTYFATGNKGAAIVELQALIKANPSVATQIQSFIDQINAGTLKP
jgi:tetratricopeptide (TPR) repeat protein